jgi:hypothetical protein
MINKSVGAMLLFCIAPVFTFGQNKNNKWLFGIAPQFGAPYNGSKLEFTSNSLNISYHPKNIWHSTCFSGISDLNNNWFMYTNGSVICNANHDTITNGDSLSPGGDDYWRISGYPVPSMALFLPSPNNNGLYYLFHKNSINGANGFPAPNRARSLQLYYTKINSLGGNSIQAFDKNTILIDDTLEVGTLSAIRHANGRDWWLLNKRFFYNELYTTLITTSGIDTTFKQPMAGIRTYNGGQTSISPNGEYYCFFSPSTQLRIYDFDRCTGMLTNYRTKFISWGISGASSFSPSSRFLYISKLDSLWQFDMQSADVLNSQILVGVYDGFVDSLGSSTMFTYHWLAPDGKIYINTNLDVGRYLHVINNPDEPGLNCNFTQHAIFLPTYNDNTIPTYVNLDLKQVPGSPCDTLGVGITPLSMGEGLGLRSYPNPSNGNISIEFPVQQTSGMLYVYDVDGKLVYSEYVSPYTYIKNINLQGRLSSGMYAISMVFGQQRFLGKLVVE